MIRWDGSASVLVRFWSSDGLLSGETMGNAKWSREVVSLASREPRRTLGRPTLVC